MIKSKQYLLLFCIALISLEAATQTPDEVIAVNNIKLPALPEAIGNYSNVTRSANLLFLSGKGPLQLDGSYVVGKLGRELTADEGYTAARLCTLALLAVLQKEVGTLSGIKRILKITVFVNGTDSFTQQPAVANGCSDLLLKIFNDKGIHARSAVGVSSLPSGWPVEVEMIVEVNE